MTGQMKTFKNGMAMGAEKYKSSVLINGILHRISSRKLRVGDYLEPERELGRKFGISRDTVRQGLARLADMGIVSRVQGSGTKVVSTEYLMETEQTEPGAKPEYGGQKNNVAFVVCQTNMQDPWNICLVHGAEEKLHDAGYNVFVKMFYKDFKSHQENRIEILQRMPVEGYILSGVIDLAFVKEVEALGKPYVVLSYISGFDEKSSYNDLEPGLSCLNQVVPDEEASNYELTKYILSLGHKKIAYIKAPLSYGEHRFKGFMRAIKAAGADVSPDFIEEIRDNDSQELEGYHIMKKWINDGIDFSVVITGVDRAAIGVYRACSEAGIVIPEKLSVAAGNGSPFTEKLQPSLTVACFSVTEYAGTGANMLLDIMGKTTSQAGRIFLKGDLLEGESCLAISEAVEAEI